MNGLQLTASGREGLGLLGHDAVSQGQAVRQTDRQTDRSAFIFKRQEVRATYTASYPRNPKSRYVTWPTARTERSSGCCCEQPGYSHLSPVPLSRAASSK